MNTKIKVRIEHHEDYYVAKLRTRLERVEPNAWVKAADKMVALLYLFRYLDDCGYASVDANIEYV